MVEKRATPEVRHCGNDLILTREQVRRCDEIAMERFGITGLVLMENAGGGAARVILSCLKERGKSRVLIFAGSGNNGGDGFVVARHLANCNISVSLVLCASRDRIKGDAWANLQIIEKMALPITWIESANSDSVIPTIDSIVKQSSPEIIIDALLGTGTSGPPREPIRSAIDAINRSSASVIALDIPSGLDCDRGLPEQYAIKADHTITFVAMKKGFTFPAARKFTGKVTVVSIGIQAELLR